MFKNLKRALILILLISVNRGICQYYPTKYKAWHHTTSTCDLQVFEDYKACLQGLKSYQNEVVLKAKYDQIWMIRDGIILNKNGRFTLMNCELKSVSKDRYSNIDGLLAPEKTFWKVTRDGKTGVIDNQGNLVVDLIYDDVEIINDIYENRPKADDKIYFKVFLDKKVGIRNEDGTLKFDSNYLAIEFVPITGGYGYQFRNYYHTFWIFEKDKGILVMDETETTLFSDSQSNAAWFDSNYPTSHIIYTYRTDSTLSKANNLVSNKSTDWLYKINRSNEGLIFGKSNEWQQRTKVYNAELDFILEMSIHDKLEIVYRTNLYKHWDYYQKGYWLIGLNNQLIAKKNYDFIESTIAGDSSFIWAGKKIENLDGTYNIEIDILNHKGILLRQIIIDKTFKYSGLNELFAGFFYSSYYHNPSFGSKYIAPRSHYFTEVDGKWGAHNTEGILIIPFEYEDYDGSFSTNRSDSLAVFKLKKNAKFGIVNERNEIVIPFIYNQITRNWKESAMTLYESDEGFTITAADGTVLVELADQVFLKTVKRHSESRKVIIQERYDSEQYPHLPKHNYTLIIKDQRLYYVVDDQLLPCDSSFLHFEKPTLLFDKIVLYEDGRLLEKSLDWEYYEGSNYYVKIKSHSARIIGFNGDELNKIKDFDYATEEEGLLKIRIQDGSVGLLNSAGDGWILKPEFHEIMVKKQFSSKNLYWVQFWDDSLKKAYANNHYLNQPFKGNWLLINDKGENHYDSIQFDYPFLPEKALGYKSICWVNGKFGLMDSSFNFILPPIYENIIPTPSFGHFIIQKDTAFAIYHWRGFHSDFYSDIVYSNYPKVFQVEKRDSGKVQTGFLGFNYSDGYYESVPMTTPVQLLQNTDLVEAIQFSIDGIEKSYENRELVRFIYSLDTAELYHQYKYQTNNQIILNYFNNRVTDMPFYNRTYLSYFPTLPRANERVVIPLTGWRKEEVWLKRNYQLKKPVKARYIEVLTNYQFVYSYKVMPGQGDADARRFDNYHFGISTKPIQFYDLFESRQKIDQFLYDYLEDYVNEKQLFGLVCPDFPSIYTNYIQNFYISYNGITFHQFVTESRSPTTVVRIPYKLLEPYFKDEVKEFGTWVH